MGPVEPADIEAVIALDQSVTGTSRRGFYQKRFSATAAHPERFVWLVAREEGRLVGFVSAQILAGEYGDDTRSAVVDAIGTARERRRGGLGGALMAALEAELISRGVGELRSEADWTERDLIGFFARTGFSLAPQLVLARDCRATADF
ncbi:GCN5-related N-acetyltransferase [Rhodovulum sp. PH10]|nr:GCN5-related N-acetyltransferase [Rhodovulum sp. PH10]